MYDFLKEIWNKVKKFFTGAIAWIARRWFLNIVFGVIALFPFIIYQGMMSGTNEMIATVFLILFVFGSIFISLGSIGFWVFIARKIYFFFKHR